MILLICSSIWNIFTNQFQNRITNTTSLSTVCVNDAENQINLLSRFFFIHPADSLARGTYFVLPSLEAIWNVLKRRRETKKTLTVCLLLFWFVFFCEYTAQVSVCNSNGISTMCAHVTKSSVRSDWFFLYTELMRLVLVQWVTYFCIIQTFGCACHTHFFFA